MMTAYDKACVYVRFVQLCAASPTKLPLLDPHEERLFVRLAVAQSRGESPSVRGVMELHQFGSPSTNHTRLKSMRAKGWLELADTDDARRKQVVLTQAAMREIRKLSRIVVRASA
jgi:SOS-response transcriptional repressor LexA